MLLKFSFLLVQKRPRQTITARLFLIFLLLFYQEKKKRGLATR